MTRQVTESKPMSPFPDLICAAVVLLGFVWIALA
jgi:hypothetical protein